MKSKNKGLIIGIGILSSITPEHIWIKDNETDELEWFCRDIFYVTDSIGKVITIINQKEFLCTQA